MIRYILYIVAGLAIAFLTILGAVRLALAHHAPSGWKYPWECCSNMDCKHVPASVVQLTNEGWRLTDQGEPEIISFADKRLRVSGDGEYHVCRTNFGKGKLLCVFIPPLVGT